MAIVFSMLALKVSHEKAYDGNGLYKIFIHMRYTRPAIPYTANSTRALRQSKGYRRPPLPPLGLRWVLTCAHRARGLGPRGDLPAYRKRKRARAGRPMAARAPLARSEEGCQGFGGSWQRVRTCRTCAEAVVMMCGSTSSKLWHAVRPFAEHAAGGRQPVQSKRAWVRSGSNFLL